MTSPELPREGSRVLHAIWDMASAASCWPMYAEIARRMSVEGDTDLEDLLSGLADGGFVVGFVRPIRATSIIGLTVAGAAACSVAEEVLWGFLAIAKAAAEQAPDFFLTSVTTLEAASGGSLPPIRIPRSEFTFTHDSWIAAVREVSRNVPERRHQAETVLLGSGCSRLLPLVVLLLKSEGLGLEDFYGPDADGRWSASFDAVHLGHFAWDSSPDLFSPKLRINFAQTVGGLDDYLSWRPGREHLVPFKLTESEQRKALLIGNPELLVDALLEWIYISAGGDTAKAIACERFRSDIDSLIIDDALHKLREEELIVPAASGSARAPTYVLLTDDGTARVQKSLRAWNDRIFRDRAARNAFLAFVYRVGEGGAMILSRDFFNSPLSAVDGHFFTWDDIAAASRYLQDKKLVRVNEFALTQLTGRGYDCIEQGGDVTEYLNRREGNTYNFGNITGNVSTGDVGSGNISQAANITQGFDADQLRMLMDAVVQALPVLALEMQDREAAQDVADQVILEVKQGQSDRSRLSRAMHRLKSILAPSAQQALTAVLTGAIDNELTRLGLPPGRP